MNILTMYTFYSPTLESDWDRTARQCPQMLRFINGTRIRKPEFVCNSAPSCSSLSSVTGAVIVQWVTASFRGHGIANQLVVPNAAAAAAAAANQAWNAMSFISAVHLARNRASRAEVINFVMSSNDIHNCLLSSVFFCCICNFVCCALSSFHPSFFHSLFSCGQQGP